MEEQKHEQEQQQQQEQQQRKRQQERNIRGSHKRGEERRTEESRSVRRSDPPVRPHTARGSVWSTRNRRTRRRYRSAGCDRARVLVRCQKRFDTIRNGQKRPGAAALMAIVLLSCKM